MSYYGTYSPLFTGSMDDPDPGVQISDYENFEHICSTVHDEWAFDPEIEWREEPDTYPKQQYAYLYGFTTHADSLSQYDECDTWSINKLTPTSPLFTNVWYAVSATCEPFSVLMNEGAAFPRTNGLAFNRGDLSVHRLDCEPGHIELVNVPLDGSEEEELVDTYDWDVETYEEERFLGGINY